MQTAGMGDHYLHAKYRAISRQTEEQTQTSSCKKVDTKSHEALGTPQSASSQ